MIILYKITNTVNQKSYIGWTSKPLGQRWRQHQSSSSPCTCLCRAIQRYGADKFVVENLTTCLSQTHAHNLERIAIFSLKTKTPYGYNMTGGGQGTLGRRLSEQAKQKLRIINKGKQLSEEHKKKISVANKGRLAWNKGRPTSVETKAKMSAIKTGKKASDETKQKMSEAHKGIKKLPHSEETKQRISETKKGGQPLCKLHLLSNKTF